MVSQYTTDILVVVGSDKLFNEENFTLQRKKLSRPNMFHMFYEDQKYKLFRVEKACKSKKKL